MVRERNLTAKSLQRLYEAKAAAEVGAADSLVPGSAEVRGSGDLLAEVVLLKGLPGPGDLRARRALAGADGEAAGKALAALGFDATSVFAACTRTVASADDPERVRRVELLVEAIDPRVVVALDSDAAADLSEAFGVALPFGRPAIARGRMLAAVDGLEASLADEAAKARVWGQFRSLKQAPAPEKKKGRL